MESVEDHPQTSNQPRFQFATNKVIQIVVEGGPKLNHIRRAKPILLEGHAVSFAIDRPLIDEDSVFFFKEILLGFILNR